MHFMNKEIYQTFLLLADSLEAMTVFSTSQKVLGYHLTAMMEDQTKCGGYTILLMQTVQEVFIVFVNNLGSSTVGQILVFADTVWSADSSNWIKSGLRPIY